MPIIGIWLDSRRKELFIDSKNTRIEVHTRKIWSSEAGVHQKPNYCANPRNRMPEGCQSILATPVNAIFQPKFALEVAL